MNVKQVIVVNNQLRSKLRHGKLAAQVAHASLGAVFAEAATESHGTVGSIEHRSKRIPLTPELEYWFNEKFTKVVLRADNEVHLLDILARADFAQIPTALITDCGNTVFHEPTITCIGIGPATEDQLKGITDNLKMY